MSLTKAVQLSGVDKLLKWQDPGLPPYIYQPLQTARSIRLLKLLQCDPLGTFIKCTLEHHDLDSCPVFEAISYTWGIPTHKEMREGEESALAREINCDDMACTISVNLFDALRQCSLMETTSYLWADAICINQMNADERASQVLLMGEIYSQSARVIVWLGKDDSDVPDVAGFQKDLDTAISDFESKYGRKSIIEQDPLDEKFLDRLGLCSRSDWINWWKIYFNFYQNHRWFRRAWVVQEIALATEILFLCGNTTLPWINLYELGATIRHNGWRHPLSIYAGMSPSGGIGDEADNLLEYRCQVQSGGPADPQFHSLFNHVDGAITVRQRWFAYFKYMIQELRRFQVMDERDKIYSVLGLVHRFSPDGLGQTLRPDYTISPAKLYTSFTETILAELPILSSLSYVGCPREDLPSWVPDYSTALSRLPFIHLGTGDIFNASLVSTIPHPEPRFSSLEGQRLVTFRGTKLTQIHSKGVQLEYKWTGESFIDILVLCNLLDPVYKLTGQSRCDALWRTLIADYTERPNKSHPAPQDYADHFHDWALTRITSSLELISVFSKTRVSERLEEVSRVLKAFDQNEQIKSPLPTPEEILESLKPASSEEARSENSLKRYLRSPAGFFLFDRAVETIHSGRCVFVTSEGHIGLGPKFLEPQDDIWILHGARVPFILRKPSNKLVGEAYVHGIMHGELMNAEFQTSVTLS
jgi:hypothetical protein